MSTGRRQSRFCSSKYLLHRHTNARPSTNQKHMRSLRTLTDESGAVLIEFVLLLPLLLVLLFGMLDFGKAYNYWIDETHLANEGARFAAVNKNPGPGATLQ